MSKLVIEGQITIDEWLSWKEDIRKKLEETAGNFVHIGYRLKQIRDSGMYDGAADVFEFAEREFGLGKSTVSRFIAINEKYSKDGNSLELKDEYKKFSSSKLSEMLTLPDSEIGLITEQTTIKEIRDLKNFDKEAEKAAQEAAERAAEEPEEEGAAVATSQQETKKAENDENDSKNTEKSQNNTENGQNITNEREKDTNHEQEDEDREDGGTTETDEGGKSEALHPDGEGEPDQPTAGSGQPAAVPGDPSPVRLTWEEKQEILEGIEYPAEEIEKITFGWRLMDEEEAAEEMTIENLEEMRDKAIDIVAGFEKLIRAAETEEAEKALRNEETEEAAEKEETEEDE